MSSTVDMSVIAHGAHDVVTAAIQRGREEHRHRSSARLSGAALEALAAAGYAVVKLPSDCTPFRVDDDGDVWDDDFSTAYTPMEAQITAERLLAAAAQSVKQGGER